MRDNKKLITYPLILFILLQMIILPHNINVIEAQGNTTPFYIALIIHIHQPIYDVSRNICEIVSNTNSYIYQTFQTRSKIYTYYVLDLIDYINGNQLPVNISIDITGTLIENFENLSTCGNIPGLENYTYIVSNWSSRSYEHVEFLSTPYHYILTPTLSHINEPAISKNILRYEIGRHNSSLQNFIGEKPGYENLVGYHPPELALDNDALDLLASLGYNYTIVDDIHIYRIFKDYSTPRRTPETWYTYREIGSSDKTDPLYIVDNIAGNWIYLEFEHNGVKYDHIMNPYIGLRPHAINTSNGDIIVFPRNRFISVLMHSIMYFTNDDIDSAVNWFYEIIDYLQQYNTDPDKPFILVMDFDGDNGDPYTHQSTWWPFLKKLIEKPFEPGSQYSYVRFVSPAWYLRHIYNPANDHVWKYAWLPFIEPGSWNTDNGWGDPYFTKWFYPSDNSNEQKMLNNITRALANYFNARECVPNDPRLYDILEWIGKAMQSDWLYYPFNEQYGNVTYAVEKAIDIARNITVYDYAAPVVMFGWYNVTQYNGWPGPIYSNSDLWIAIHMWDASGVVTAGAYIYLDTMLYRSYTLSEIPGYSGTYYIHVDTRLVPGKKLILEIYARDGFLHITRYRYTLGIVVDQKYLLDGVLNNNAKPLWINNTNTYLQTLFVNDTSNPIYLGYNTTRQGSGYDTFVFITSNPSNGRLPQPWSKYGYVPYYNYYIGMEENNGWSGLWYRLNGLNGEADVLIGCSWMIDYKWDPVNGFGELVIDKELFKQYYNTDRLFIGIGAWGTSDWSTVYEKLRMVSTRNSLYNDELIGIYLDQPYLKTYFTPEDGIEVLNNIINSIRDARSYVYIAIYNWNNHSQNSLIWRIAEEVVNAKNRGVWIAVVVDGEHYYTDPLEYLRDNGIYVVRENDNGLMHNKFIVIDGVIIYTGSANLVDQAYSIVNDEYQYNDVLEIHSTWFSKPYEYEFIEMRYKEVFHGGDPTPTPLAQQTILLNDTWVGVEYYFSPEDGNGLENTWNNYIGSSTTVYVLSYMLTLNSIGSSLVSLYNNGGDVKIIIYYDERNASGSEYQYLLQNNVPVTLNYDENIEPGYQILHHKVFIFNNETISTGSANPTYSGLYSNDENTIIIHWKKLGEIYRDRFIELWNKYTAHITVKVFEGDQVVSNVYVNITTYDLNIVTDNLYTIYSYTGYTNNDGLLSVEAYLWNPYPTAYFTINASITGKWNYTTIYLSLDNNTAYVEIYLSKHVKPYLLINGSTTTYVGVETPYIITITYPNETRIDMDIPVDIYVNNTYTDTITLVDGENTWIYIPTKPGLTNITVIYNGGYWIDGLVLDPTSNYTLVNVNWRKQSTDLVIIGPTIAYYGDTIEYTIELVNATDNSVIPVDAIIEIYINNSFITTVALDNGVGTWIMEYDRADTYTLLFIYRGGDTIDNYLLEGCSKTTTVIIREAPTTLYINAPNTGYIGSSIEINVILKDIRDHSIANALIELYVNGSLIDTKYTDINGKAVFLYTPNKAGELDILVKYKGDAGKYLGSSTSLSINIISGIETKLSVIGSATLYIGDTGKYIVYLTYPNNTKIPIDAGLEIYFNGSREIIPMNNGVAVIYLTANVTGMYNLTIFFNGGSYHGITLLPSNTTMIITCSKRPVKIIVMDSRYIWINSTHIYLYIVVNVKDNVTGKPVTRGYLEIYMNKSGNLILIDKKPVVNGKVVLSNIYDPSSPFIRIIYIDPSGIYQSGLIEGAFYETVVKTKITPPMPEPYITPLILIISTVIYMLYRRNRSF